MHKYFSLALFLMFFICASIRPAQASGSSVARILITKTDRLLYLFDRQGNVLKSYKVSLGPSPFGHKEQEGDGRTPEGRYVIDHRNEQSEYYKSLHISYPNHEDIVRARKKGFRPGGAIFIHGLPNGRSWQRWKYNNRRDWTRGCIAVNNDEIQEIWDYVPNGTPVTIVP